MKNEVKALKTYVTEKKIEAKIKPELFGEGALKEKQLKTAIRYFNKGIFLSQYHEKV